MARILKVVILVSLLGLTFCTGVVVEFERVRIMMELHP